MATKNCAICGVPSGIYPLCAKCFKLRDAGKVVQCADCKAWHHTDRLCICKPAMVTVETKPAKILELATKLSKKCLTCDMEVTAEYLFCIVCYRKYANKTLLLKVEKCKEISILDESYEGIYVCKDGHIVKSKSEREIDNFLFDKGIQHAYEKQVKVNAKTTIKPDFYLPDVDVYLEHWGYDESNAVYTAQKKFKMDYYLSKKKTVICTTEKRDAKDINGSLEFYLDAENYKIGEINFNE